MYVLCAMCCVMCDVCCVLWPFEMLIVDRAVVCMNGAWSNLFYFPVLGGVQFTLIYTQTSRQPSQTKSSKQ
ncbi:hypothetical protein F4782DRAFT_359618 [Xylaria castorea]|nr:hypothetical protein F4782DRAFT_359618 [Xylaria castorea]